LDAAAVALEAAAHQVHVFTRRSELLVQGPSRNIGRNVGAKENFHRRSDADRWRAQVLAARAGRSCTLESVTRAAAFPGFRVHLSAPWRHARADGGKVRVDAADGSHVFDFVLAGTGYQYDPRTRPELAEIAPHIALWRDRYEPPAELTHESLGCFPYLGPGYELVEKVPGTADFAGRIHVFSAAAGLSFGIPAGDAQSLATGIPRLVDALSRDLFFEDQEHPQPARPRPTDTHRSVYEHAIWTP
jgi:hypothetical protein